MYGLNEAGADVRALLTAGADGTVRVFALDIRGRQPATRHKGALQAPAAGIPATGASRRPFYTAFAVARRGDCAEQLLDPPEPDEVLVREEVAMLVAGFDTGALGVWNLAAPWVLLATLPGHEAAVTAVLAKPTSTGDYQLVSASTDGSIRLWSVATDPAGNCHGHCRCALDFGRRNPVSAVAFLPDQLCAACSWDGTLRLLDLSSPRCASLAQASACCIRSLAVACSGQGQSGSSEPGGARVYLGADDGQVTSWAFSTCGSEAPSRVDAWKAHGDQVTAMLVTGTWLLTGSEDRTVKVWLDCGPSLLETFRGHAGAILCLSEAAPDRLFWSASRDWSVRSWDLMEVEQHIWECDRMLQVDGESMAVEQEARAQQKMAKKQKKKPPAKKAAAK